MAAKSVLWDFIGEQHIYFSLWLATVSTSDKFSLQSEEKSFFIRKYKTVFGHSLLRKEIQLLEKGNSLYNL